MNAGSSHPFVIKTVQGTGTSNQVSTGTYTGGGASGSGTVKWITNGVTLHTTISVLLTMICTVLSYCSVEQHSRTEW